MLMWCISPCRCFIEVCRIVFPATRACKRESSHEHASISHISWLRGITMANYVSTTKRRGWKCRCVCVCVCLYVYICACKLHVHVNFCFTTTILQVKVDVHSGLSQSTKNTKSLSGGERSYTTVCFIMSLWEAMEAPFRCLDEFDVFMVSLI